MSKRYFLLATSLIVFCGLYVQGQGTICCDQIIDYDSRPSTITEINNGGGTCTGSGIYTWQRRTIYNGDWGSWQTVPGAGANSSYRPLELTQSTQYRRRRQCSGAYSNNYTGYSNTITITVKVDGRFLTPATQTICYGTQPNQIGAIAADGGGGESFSYQWEQSVDGGTTWNNAPGTSTGLYYQPPVLTQTTRYRRKATDSYDESVGYSTIAHVTVRADLIPGTIGHQQSICNNLQPAQLAGTAASGGSGLISYQWQNSTNNITWNNIGNATSQNYQPPALTQTTHYRRLTIDQTCGTKESNQITITVIPVLNPGTIGNNQTICEVIQPAELIGSTATGGSGTINYQWQQSTNGTTWNNVVNAISQNYRPPILSQTTFFRRQAKSATTACDDTRSSNVVEIKIEEFTGGTISDNQTICHNSVPQKLIETEPAGNCETSYTYQWRVSTNGTSWAPAQGISTLKDFEPGNLSVKTYFLRRVWVGNNSSNFKESNIITIDVVPALNPGSLNPLTEPICHNTAPTTISGIQATGGGGNYNYSWWSSTEDLIYERVLFAQNHFYQPPPLTQTTYYKRRVSNEFCVYQETSPIMIEVKPRLTQGTISQNQTICYNTQPNQLTGPPGQGGFGNYKYSWEMSQDQINWSEISDATDEYYQPTILTQTTYFRRKVTSSECDDVSYSNNVSIQVYDILSGGSIIPNVRAICYNAVPPLITVSSSLNGSGYLSYQWQESTNGTNWTNISNATDAQYRPPALTQDRYYRRQVTDNICQNIMFSEEIWVQIKPEFYPGKIEGAQSICKYTIPAPLVETEEIKGCETDRVPVITYVWEQSTDNLNWSVVVQGTNEKNYQPPALSQTTYYRRVIRDPLTNIIYYSNTDYLDNTIEILIFPDFSPGTIPDEQNICFNVQTTIIGSPAIGSGNFSYQWQIEKDNIWFDAEGTSDQQNFTPPPIYFARYRRFAMDETCPRVYYEGNEISNVGYSNSVDVNIYSEFIPGTISENQKICYNRVPDSLKGERAEGGSYNHSYQWEQSYDNVNWTEIEKANGTDYSPTNLQVTTYYRRKVTDVECGEKYSNTVTIEVFNDLSAGTIGYSHQVCSGITPNEIIRISSASGGTGTYTYQWQQSANGGISWSNINEATRESYRPPILSQTTIYRRETINMCSSAYSNEVTVTLKEFNPGTIGTDEEIAYNSQPTLMNTSTPAIGQDYFQWQQNDSDIWLNIPDAIYESYQPEALLQTTVFRRHIISIECGIDVSNLVTKIVHPELNGGFIGYDRTVCNNLQQEELVSVIDAYGGNGIYNYFWEKSIDGENWNEIFEANVINYQPEPISEKTFYRRKTTAGIGGTAYSNIVEIDIYPELIAAQIGSTNNNLICYNSAPGLLQTTSSAAGGNGIYVYQWQESINEIIWNDIPDADLTFFEPSNLLQTTFFRLKTINLCGEAYSNSVNINVSEEFLPGTIGIDQEITYGDTPNMINVSISPSGGNGEPYAYQWQQSIDQTIWVNVNSNGTNASYQPPALTQTMFYKRLTTNQLCGTKETNIVVITVYETVDGGLIANNQIICYGTRPDEIVDSANPSGGDGTFTFSWEESTTGTLNWTTIVGATEMNYQSLQNATVRKYYRRLATAGVGGSAYSNIVEVDVYPELLGAQIGNNQTVCYNSIPNPLIITTQAVGGTSSYEYQWQQSFNGTIWNDIQGATLTYYNPTTLTETTFFRLNTINLCGEVHSNIVNITVSEEFNPGTIGIDQEIISGNIPNMLNVSTPPSGANGGPYTYQWQQSTNEITWVNVNSSGTNASYQPPALTQTTFYKRLTTNQLCGTKETNIVTITVYETVDGGLISNNQIICYGTRPDEIIDWSYPSGGNGTFTFSWEESTTGTSNWTTIVGETEINYQPQNATVKKFYRRLATAGVGGSAYSNIVEVDLYPDLVGAQIGYDQTVCYNDDADALTIISTAAGGTGNYQYQWQQSFNGTIWQDVNANTWNNAYKPENITQTTYYRLNALSCDIASSNIVTIDLENVTTDLTINLLDKYQVENGQLIFFNPNVVSSHYPPTSMNYQWEFIHESKGLYERHFDMEPAQFFYWAGWHTAKLTVTTTNNCVFIETKQRLFFIEQEKPNPDPKIIVENPQTEADSELSIKISPNPFDNELKISINSEGYTCYLFMLTGQKIIEKPLSAGDNILPTSNLSSGVYVISVTTEKGETVFLDKLIKQIK